MNEQAGVLTPIGTGAAGQFVRLFRMCAFHPPGEPWRAPVQIMPMGLVCLKIRHGISLKLRKRDKAHPVSFAKIAFSPVFGFD
ncbi:MAG: hypothetical protein RLZZ444_4082 [Pseudomonadota bacterium]